MLIKRELLLTGVANHLHFGSSEVAMVVAGRLNVLSDDPFGLYYRLTEAQLSGATR